jgi:hypothetical protein
VVDGELSMTSRQAAARDEDSRSSNDVGSDAMPEGSELLSMVTTTAGIYGTAPTCHLSGLARMPTSTVESLDEAIEGAPRNRFLSPLSNG